MHYLRFLLAVYLCLLAAPVEAQLVRLPEPVRLSPEGQQLILDFEVGGGERYYNRHLIRPEWPGFASGVTWGCGYDGGYNSRAVILSDWHGLNGVNRLASTSGVTGRAAKDRLAEVRDILVPWAHALGVFNSVTVTRFYQLAQRTFPGFERLRPNAQAALVSLVFNRGSSMAGPRRAEMRAIRDLVLRSTINGQPSTYGQIAREIRAMKRLWRGTDIEEGMSRRREAEAQLAETP